MSELNWYPVYTHSRAEKKAAAALNDKGIMVYLPECKQLRQWSDRKKMVDMPLLPSYLFVQIAREQMPEVLSTKGVSRFIYFSGKVAIMPERQITQLKLLTANASDLEVVEEDFEEGQQVLVKAGPLLGLRGELVSWRSSDRVLVRIEYINQSILVQVSKAFLEVF